MRDSVLGIAITDKVYRVVSNCKGINDLVIKTGV